MSKRTTAVLVSIVILAFAAAGLPVARTVGPTVAQASATETNYLADPGFEGPFSARPDPYYPQGGAASQLGIAAGWELWYDNDQSCPPYDLGCDPDSYNKRPEYKAEVPPGRVHGGQQAQKMFFIYSTHTAGLYQQVQVPAASWVRFSIWVWAWSSQKDVADHSFQPGDYRVAIGIDPQGGTDWWSSDIIWGDPVVRHDQWVYLEVDAYTDSGQISVWTRGAPIWPVKHNDSYWDDAALVVLPEEPQPTPTPTQTKTPLPTPDPTPDGYVPPTCAQWYTLWDHPFDEPTLDGWGTDPSRGSVAVEDGALRLRNGSVIWESFPLAWIEADWPASRNLSISFRFAYTAQTGYGTTIGIGSERYDGERTLAGLPGTYGIDNILNIHQRMGEFRIALLGTTVWLGTPGDSTWHSVHLRLDEHTYILELDGTEIGRGVSYWRPQSFFVGNPVILWIKGFWTELRLDDLKLGVCQQSFLLPVVVKNHVGPLMTPTATPEPSPTASPSPSMEPTATPTASQSATATASPSSTPSVTATTTSEPSPTASPMASVTPTPTGSASPTVASSPSPTPSITVTASALPEATSVPPTE